jgi:hypothetical protein
VPDKESNGSAYTWAEAEIGGIADVRLSLRYSGYLEFARRPVHRLIACARPKQMCIEGSVRHLQRHVQWCAGGGSAWQ